MTSKVKRLTESAMLLAVATVLEFLSKMLIPELPFGGQLTVCSMLPVVLISYRHGLKWGLGAAFTYSLIQMLLGAKTVAGAFQPGTFGDGVMIANALTMCLLDYVLAYTALGLGGIFRNRVQNPRLSLMLGSLVALLGRFCFHVLSGYILYASWAEWFFTQEGFPAWGAQLVQNVEPGTLGFLYSLVYNGFYMVPEMVITAVGAVLIARPGIAEKQ